MAITTQLKRYVNALLAKGNLQLESLTAERVEMSRLKSLESTGHFERPVFAVPESFRQLRPAPLLDLIAQYEPQFARFDKRFDQISYTFDNEYFSSPDAELLYTVIRLFQPATILEVGSGNSTRLARHAITDGSLSTQLISIDPDPRVEISAIADRTIRTRVEANDPEMIANQLGANDILFVDSSHVVKPGGDVCFLFLEVLPKLRPGVLVHVHDIFSPYEYPREWIVDCRWDWTEQYLIQALLSSSSRFEVLWAGHYLQRSLPEFSRYFPRANGRRASSLWFRVRP